YSVVIACVATTAAFWILYRVLPIYPSKELFRQAAAFLMAWAVVGMHYMGMMAANFEEDETRTSRVPYGLQHMSSALQIQIGLRMTVCVALVTVMIPLADLRYSVQRLCYELSRADDMILSLDLPPQSADFKRMR
ncbi:hypothetical protein B484DRAFT_441035, partial [Ochromonadaceae sp. CCMP2298]